MRKNEKKIVIKLNITLSQLGKCLLHALMTEIIMILWKYIHLSKPSYKFYTSFCSSYLVLEKLSYVIIALDSPHVTPPMEVMPSCRWLIYG